VAQQIRDRIAGGEYVEGLALPSEALLMEAFRVSRMTVRRALGLLREEGLVGTRRGRVAWVRARPVRQRIVLDAGCTLIGRMPSADERAALGIERGVPLLEIRAADGSLRRFDAETVEVVPGPL
jgi:DNA-binding transcriptional MocR family regulator